MPKAPSCEKGSLAKGILHGVHLYPGSVATRARARASAATADAVKYNPKAKPKPKHVPCFAPEP